MSPQNLPSSVLSVAVSGDGADGSPAGSVHEPYLGLDDWGAGEHSYRRRPAGPAPIPASDPPVSERPGPDAGDGPWTIELTIEVTTLDA